MSGTEMSDSGSSGGVPGTTFTRASRWVFSTRTASRCSTAHPVMPSPNRGRIFMISLAHWSRASSGISTRWASSASKIVSVSYGTSSASVSATRRRTASRLSSDSKAWKTSASRRYESTRPSAGGAATSRTRGAGVPRSSAASLTPMPARTPEESELKAAFPLVRSEGTIGILRYPRGIESPGRGNVRLVPRQIETAAPLVPERPTMSSVRAAAADCKACPLWQTGTQTVFGEGLRSAEIMFVGEQPGDREDREGSPFVGPAGRLLDEALVEAGIDRRLAYVTNVVKHFKWVARGKRRIHQKPNWSEIAVCTEAWLAQELAVIRPEVVVCLGATAAQALLGRQFRVTKQRGTWVESDLAPHVTATIHPSAILRQRTDEERHLEMERLVADLKLVASVLEEAS